MNSITLSPLRSILVLLIISYQTLAFAFYNPTAGRWLSRDPLGERAGSHAYAFASSAPISFVDTLGLRALVDDNPCNAKGCSTVESPPNEAKIETRSQHQVHYSRSWYNARTDVTTTMTVDYYEYVHSAWKQLGLPILSGCEKALNGSIGYTESKEVSLSIGFNANLWSELIEIVGSRTVTTGTGTTSQMNFSSGPEAGYYFMGILAALWVEGFDEGTKTYLYDPGFGAPAVSRTETIDQSLGGVYTKIGKWVCKCACVCEMPQR